MKYRHWLKILILLTGILLCTLAVSDDEPDIVTEVAVQTGKITKATLHGYVMAYGIVEPQPATGGKLPASSKIAAPSMGILTQIYCEEGQQVKKGALLFELDTRSTDALIAKAEVAVEFAQKNFARKQQLSATDNISRKLYDEAEQLLQTARKDLLNAQTQRALLQIKAPLSGTVAAIHFKIGEAVNLNTILADLIDLNRLDIAIRVPSLEAAGIRIGQAVDISTAAMQVWDVNSVASVQRGTVDFIGSQVDPLTDTMLIRTSLNNDTDFRPGQFVSVRIVVEEHVGRLAVPVESVVTRENVSIIVLVDGDKAKQQVIKPGLREGDLIEVTGENLQEGRVIVTQGVYGLPAETRIRVLQ